METDEKREQVVKVLTHISIRPWLLRSFRDDPSQFLGNIPGLTSKELEGIASGNRGIIYNLIALPFWLEIIGRIPVGSTENLIATESDINDQMELSTIDHSTTFVDHDTTDHDTEHDDTDNRDVSPPVIVAEVLEKMEAAALWISLQKKSN